MILPQFFILFLFFEAHSLYIRIGRWKESSTRLPHMNIVFAYVVIRVHFSTAK